MDINEKCAFIMRKILELANERGQVSFERDFGGNTLTILLSHIDRMTNETKGVSHTHVGVPSGTFEVLVDNLYNDKICVSRRDEMVFERDIW